MGNQFSITDQERSFGEDNSTQKEDDEEAMCIVPTRVNLFFPNEILEKIVSFLSIRDKLIGREVCTQWMNHINGEYVRDSVKVKVCSDELNDLANSSNPVFTSFYFHKVDLTRQSLHFWSLYSDVITYLEFYDSAIIPRNTADSSAAEFKLGCPNLKHLALINCDKYFLMGGKFIQLHEILCLENLESLNLSRNKNLTDNILFSILMKTNKLESLDLSDCINMVFMTAVHNRFYSAAGPSGSLYSDHILSFHTLCTDYLLTTRAANLKQFNFGMKLNTTGMELILLNDSIKWKCANLESPELKVNDIKRFITTFTSSLIKLELGRCKLTADDLVSVNLQQLVEFTIHDSRAITSMHFLTCMPNLRRLVLDGSIDFDLKSEELNSLSNLQELSLNGIKPNQDSTTCAKELEKSFTQLQKLISLDVGNCTQIINDEVAQCIIMNLKGLKRLNLEATCVSDFGLTGIKTEPGKSFGKVNVLLDAIQLESKNPSNVSLTALENLEYLNVSHCRDLGDLTWNLAIKLPNLISLNLSSCGLSKRGILAIINNCRSLEHLNLVRCPRQIITDSEVLSAAKEKLYRCKGITY